MSIWKAILLGIVQGITSVLPVSSSGHISLLGHLFGDSSIYTLRFMVFLHAGTLLAVLWTFKEDVFRILRAFLSILLDVFLNVLIFFRYLLNPEKRQYRSLVHGSFTMLTLLIMTAMVPTVVIGLVIRRFAYTGASNLLLSAMGFFVTALLLLISSYTVTTKKNPMMTRYRDAALIGLFQGFSALPGISRAGMVWSGASLCGLTGPYRVRLVYLLAVPAIAGGLISVAPAAQSSETLPSLGACIIAAIVSALISKFMLQTLKRLLSRVSGLGFALYTLVIGIVCIVVSFR